MYNINKGIKIILNSLELLPLRRCKKIALTFMKLHFCSIFYPAITKSTLDYLSLQVKNKILIYLILD